MPVIGPNEIKSYNISDDWRDLNIFNEVYVESADGMISVQVNGEDVGGGGGSSDFSTAEVKIINTSSSQKTFRPTFIVNTDDDMLDAIGIGVVGNGENNIVMVLYKNTAYLIPNTAHIESVVGDATLLEEGGQQAITVAGDCTITIS